MQDQDDLIMADFGRTDSTFWRKRLAALNFKPPPPPEPDAESGEVTAPEEGYYKGDDGKTYYSDGKKLSEVN